MKRGNSYRVWFDLSNAGWSEHSHSRNTIAHGSVEDVLQPPLFKAVERYDKFAALDEWQTSIAAELSQKSTASPTQPSLETTGLIVEPCVDDSRIVPGLMRSS
ncbi:hypothetical protein GCM10027267_24420 [Paramicrobacterium agarici]